MIMLNSLNGLWDVNEAFGGVEKEVPGASEDDVDWEGWECVDRMFNSRGLTRRCVIDQGEN